MIREIGVLITISNPLTQLEKQMQPQKSEEQVNECMIDKIKESLSNSIEIVNDQGEHNI